MAGKSGPETRLVKKMRDAGRDKYGSRFVSIKYHGSQFGEAGVSDLLCVIDGLFVACEVKAPESYGGSVMKAEADGATLKQLAFGARVEKAGGTFAVVASVESFLETLAFAVRKARNQCGGCIEARQMGLECLKHGKVED